VTCLRSQLLMLLPNFAKVSQAAVDLLIYCVLWKFKMAAAAILDFVGSKL